MNIKKIIAGTMAVALTAAVSVGGTLAYLMDTDEDVNVMTLGDVYIDQIEQERVDDTDNQTELKDFEQNQPLLPAVFPGSSIPWAPENEWVVPGDQAWKVVQDNTNVIDKFVTVKNTGKSDAYVRTIFAFEWDLANDYIHLVSNGTNITEGATWKWEYLPGVAEIGGSKYMIGIATYTEPVKPGATTIPSLKQVYMNKAATNEYCEQFGDTYDILVFSQAVQTEGFDSIIVGPEAALDEAFGEVTLTANPWLNGESSFAPASKGVIPALAEGGKVTLSSDVTVTDEAAAAKNVITKDTTLNFGGNTINLDLPNATGATENWVGVNVEGGNVVFEGANGGITCANNEELYCAYVRNGANLTINGGSYIGGFTAVHVRQGTLTINGGYFETLNTDTRYVINCTDAEYRDGNAKVIIQGGSFLNWNPANNAAEGAGTNFVPAGYVVVEEKVANGTLYTVISDAEALQNDLTAGGNVTLSKDIVITDNTADAKNVVNGDTKIDFADKTINLDISGADENTPNWIGVEILGGDVVFDGTTGGIKTAANEMLYCSYIRNGATLTINGGNYSAGCTAVHVREGVLTINGGYFEATDYEGFVINCTDANYKAGTAQVIIKGGSFLNWNPANNAAEGAGTNFVADGYTVVKETVAGGTLYTVVAAAE